MTSCELLVLGGGIAGLGVARAAARAGVDTLLVDRSDLAAGASSASSHMLHGGLRYLEQGHMGLVRQALRERANVLRMAPELAAPCRFVVPVYGGTRVGMLRLRAGLALYDMLAGRSRLVPADILGAAEARALEPGLRADGLLGAGLYSDGVMDDGRLAVAVARDALRHGAVIRTWHEVIEARRVEGGPVELTLRDQLAGPDAESAPLVVRARVVVNATGAWCDATRRWLLPRLGAGPRAAEVAPLLRPSRGIHLVYPALTGGQGILFFSRSDGRVIFLVPFSGHTLVGTTEAETASPPRPEEFRATVEEVRYLRRELARVIPAAAGLRPLAVTSGLRPILAGHDVIGAASREHRVVAEGPLVTLAGGKYTTFLVMARDALTAIWPRLRRGGAPLPADSLEALPMPAPLDEEAFAAGGEAAARACAAFVELAVTHDAARRLEDVVRRRTRLWLDPARARPALPGLSAALATRLGWSAERTARECQIVEAAWAADAALIHQSEETP